MKLPQTHIKRVFGCLTVALVLPCFSCAFGQSTQPLPAVGTSAVVGSVLDVTVEIAVQSPSGEATPLQVACVFEYLDGDIFTSPPALPAAVNGMVHVDQQLHGLITDLRKNGKFAGHALETLLIIPPKGTIAAQKLLLIGLGDRKKFTPELMTDVGRVGMREALRLGVSSYAHASDLKDGGVDSPTAVVAGNILKGAFDAYTTERYLKEKTSAPFKPLTKLTLLAGPAFYVTTEQAAKTAVLNFNR